MNPIKSIYCRMVQAVLRAALPVLPYREPEIFRSCGELHTVFEKEHIQQVLIVTDEGIVRSGIAGQLEDALDNCGIAYTVYSETRPSPTVANVEAALPMYHREGCQALIAIGGGSSMDCAKAVGARMNIPAHLEGIQENDIFSMAAHAKKEANPLYPVPRLMTRQELERFYRQVAAKE